MDQLDLLRKQLNAASVSDDMISRGVRLTPAGIAKLCRKFNVSEDELKEMLETLKKEVKGEVAHTGLPSSPDIMEDCGLRFEYEADVLGNVMLRDSKTGATKYLQGSEGAKLLAEIERVHPDYQGIIAPYFEEKPDNHLMEDQVALEEADSGETGGTYNFPFQGNFACARFWLAGDKPMLEVISVVDENGEEMVLNDETKATAEAVAWEWVNKV